MLEDKIVDASWITACYTTPFLRLSYDIWQVLTSVAYEYN